MAVHLRTLVPPPPCLPAGPSSTIPQLPVPSAVDSELGLVHTPFTRRYSRYNSCCLFHRLMICLSSAGCPAHQRLLEEIAPTRALASVLRLVFLGRIQQRIFDDAFHFITKVEGRMAHTEHNPKFFRDKSAPDTEAVFGAMISFMQQHSDAHDRD